MELETTHVFVKSFNGASDHGDLAKEILLALPLSPIFYSKYHESSYHSSDYMYLYHLSRC